MVGNGARDASLREDVSLVVLEIVFCMYEKL